MKTKKNFLIRPLVLSFCLLAASTVFAASDAKSQAQSPAQPKAPAMAMDTPSGAATYAPHLPGWIKHLPADKQETVKKIWLTDGRTMYAYKEWLTAKRHELSSLVAMPGADDKAITAAIKEIVNTEEKLLNAKVAFARKLEKEGIPAWAHLDMMDHGMGQGGMMGGMMGGMGDKGMGCMGGMKDDMGSMQKPGTAPAADTAKPASGGMSH